MTDAPHPEPQGYRSAPGFVKSNPLNNDHYVEQFSEHPWYPILKLTHERLTELIPGYNISQIKEKFGGLRFYFDPPDVVLPTLWYRTADDVHAAVAATVAYAEGWVYGFEYLRKQGEKA